jgi:hypothetical protein
MSAVSYIKRVFPALRVWYHLQPPQRSLVSIRYTAAYLNVVSGVSLEMSVALGPGSPQDLATQQDALRKLSDGGRRGICLV